jgi:hypothetical protein
MLEHAGERLRVIRGGGGWWWMVVDVSVPRRGPASRDCDAGWEGKGVDACAPEWTAS